MDVALKWALIRNACVALRGPEYCSETVVQAIGAIARHETGFGTFKPFALPATAISPAFQSFDWGAQQCRVKAKNGVCPVGCFPAKDTSPTDTGASVEYLACFEINADDAAGARSLVKLLTVSRPGIGVALQTGNCQTIAQAMRDARYFEGFGATERARIRGYAVALDRNGQMNAADAHAANLLTLPAEITPDIVVLGSLIVGGLVKLARLYRARRAEVDAEDDLDPDADTDPDVTDPPDDTDVP